MTKDELLNYNDKLYYYDSEKGNVVGGVVQNINEDNFVVFKDDDGKIGFLRSDEIFKTSKEILENLLSVCKERRDFYKREYNRILNILISLNNGVDKGI